MPVPSQESERSCICVLGLLILPIPSQENERSCICVLGLLILPVPSQESERCICVLWVYILPLSGIFLFVCGTVFWGEFISFYFAIRVWV